MIYKIVTPLLEISFKRKVRLTLKNLACLYRVNFVHISNVGKQHKIETVLSV